MGGSGGPLGGLGGSAEPKNEIIVLRPILVLECIVLGHNNLLHYDFGVLGQNWALRAKKRPFWAKIGFAENWIFLKNIDSNFDENARKVLFWVNNELRKKWARSFIENFSGCQKWNFWSRAPFGPFLSPGDSPVGPKLFYTVYLGGTHPYHILGPLNRPLRHSRAPKRARFGPERAFWGPHRDPEGPGGPDLVPTAANWSDRVGIMVTRHFDLVFGLFRAPRAPKRARFGPKRAQIGSKLKIVANLLCDLSKFAQEDHSANEEYIIMIRWTSLEKNPKNYQSGQIRNSWVNRLTCIELGIFPVKR